MVRFIIKRILSFIPTLFFVTLIGFYLLSISSDKAINAYISNPNTIQNNHLTIEKQKQYWTKKLGFDLPVFYLSVVSLSENTYTINHYIPVIKYNGINNQYHRWFFGSENSNGVIKGDFGISYKTQEPVSLILKERVSWSVFYALASIILAYLISVPFGIKLVKKKQTPFYKWTHRFLFFIYTLPPFFVGMILLMLFANKDVLQIFPASGTEPIDGTEFSGYFGLISSRLPYVILPLIVYTYSSLAFITKLTENSLSNELHLDYIKTAKAKGLSDNQLIYKHALKNSLLPLVTVFSSVFPGIIGGSVIIENLFSIPGMGNETIKSVIANDYPIVIAIITISSCITLCAYLISDILYAVIDKRINLQA